jgi:hypothetical protein
MLMFCCDCCLAGSAFSMMHQRTEPQIIQATWGRNGATLLIWSATPEEGSAWLRDKASQGIKWKGNMWLCGSILCLMLLSYGFAV